MALAITDDHRSLGDVVRSFAADRQLRGEARRALETESPALPDAWKQIADLGWLGLHLPEGHGGSGFGLAEMAVVTDELGYAVPPGPFLATVAASAIVAQAGNDGQRERYLPGLADGTVPAGLGLAGGLIRGPEGLIDGTVPAVLGGRWASLLLLRAGEDLIILDAADPAVLVDPVGGIDPSLGLASVRVSALLPPAEVILPKAARAGTTLLRALAAAEAAGGARACLDLALDYAKVREQFGRTIGGFQAVKHHLANMLVGVELATALAWDANRGAASAEEAMLAAAAAASFAVPNYREAAQKAIQILGGIGFTWEHDAHLYLRRAAALSAVVVAAGDADGDVYALAGAGVRRQYAVDLPPEAAQYRAQAQAFLARYRQSPESERRGLLAESGYLVPHWPQPFGRAASPVEQLVLEEELAEVEKPMLGIGGWVLLTLTQTASREQIDRWVRPSLLGEYYWCQLFSEPNAGSDAAAVQTKGVKVDGGWRVTGQKVWTSGAQHSNRGLATVRTDPAAPKHKGITAMVIDLNDPGVEVRPLREITGEALFNEVFINDVFIPDADVVGEVNDGWRVARATLGNERVTIGGGSREGLSAFELLELAARYEVSDTENSHAIGRLLVEEQAMRVVNLRQVTRAVTGSGPGPEGNVTKLLSAEHAQRVTELAMRLAGPAAITGDEERVAFEYLFDRCLSIAGGTSEITRNVIAERILGLPRDPLVRLSPVQDITAAGEGVCMAVEERTLDGNPAFDDRGKHYKWIALSNTTLGILMVTINQSILLISLPALFRGIDLNPLVPSNTSYFLWVFMGFTLVTAVLVVSLGRVGDIYGRVKMYNLGFAVFTLFSILLSVTWLTGPAGATWIIVMRVFQGIGGAFLFANSTAILTDAFPQNERGKAMGINGIAAVGGSFLGLILGGVLAPVEWRLVFLVSVPFGLFGTVWAYLKLKDNGIRIQARIDWLGNALFAIGLIALLTGIVYSLLPYGGSPTGWSNPWVLTGIFGGIAVLVVFSWVETKVPEPMFRLNLFRIRAFTAGNIAGLLGALGRGGMQFMLIIWLQGIWLPQHGYDFSQTPLWAGIYMVPLTIGFLLLGPVSGILSDRYGARVLATAGLLVSMAAFLLLELLPINFSYIWFALLIFLFAAGMGLFFSPNQASVMNSLPPDQRGAGAGMLNTFQNSATVLSMGLFFTVVTLGLASRLPAHLYKGLVAAGVSPNAAHLVASEPPIGVLFSAFLGFNPVQQLLSPTGALSRLSPSQLTYITGRSFFPSLIEQPFSSGLHLAFTFAAVATAIAVVFSALRGKLYVHATEPVLEEMAEGAAETAGLAGLDEAADLSGLPDRERG